MMKAEGKSEKAKKKWVDSKLQNDWLEFGSKQKSKFIKLGMTKKKEESEYNESRQKKKRSQPAKDDAAEVTQKKTNKRQRV